LVKKFDQREAAIMLGVALLTDGICPQQIQELSSLKGDIAQLY
jgi:hypothetical protein